MPYIGKPVKDGPFRSILFDASAVAAGTLDAVHIYYSMTEFAGIAVETRIELVVNDYPDTETGMDRDTYHVRHVITETFLADDRQIGLIFQIHGNAKTIGQRYYRGCSCSGTV